VIRFGHCLCRLKINMPNDNALSIVAG
jgi:hypothetical protein